MNKIGEPIAISRDSAIKIAFSLEMDSEEAQEFLTHNCWHDSFYMRDFKDIIYKFFLDQKLDYMSAVGVIADFKYLDHENPEAKAPTPRNIRITEHLINQYEKNVSTVAELGAFLKSNACSFGSFRRKAYEKFVNMYDMIKNQNIVDISDVPTDDEICEMLLMKIPSLRGANRITNRILKKENF